MDDGDLISFEEVQPPANPFRVNNGSVGMEEVIALHSLLLQFSHPKVRGDFLSGELRSHVDNSEDWLHKLDALRVAVMPQWHGSETVMKQRAKVAAHHISGILRKSEEICALNPNADNRLTYAEWNNYLTDLATVKYWAQTPFSSRCVHYLPDIQQDPVAGSRQIKKEERSLFGRRNVFASEEEDTAGERLNNTRQTRILKKPPSRTYKYDASDESDGEGCKKYSLQKQAHSSPLVRMEEIILTDSDEGPDGSLLDACQASFHDSVNASSKPRPYRRIVKPQPFEMDGRQHLKSFLDTYEYYFEREYAGTSQECTQELRKYLKGELRDIYDILGGREVSYPDMRYELLRWYKEEKVGGKQYWRNQLKDAKPKSGESLQLYGLRLKDIASRAYSTDKVECARQLRNAFLETVPEDFADEVNQVEQYQRIVTRQTGSKIERLSWISIMELAREYDRKHKQVGRETTATATDKLVYFNRTSAEDLPEQPGNTYSRETNTKGHSRVFSKSKSTVPVCYYCGKKGHIEINCRKKQGLCLICGGSHKLEDCPNYKSKRSKLRCSTCRGDHLGKDCPGKTENSSVLN